MKTSTFTAPGVIVLVLVTLALSGCSIGGGGPAGPSNSTGATAAAGSSSPTSTGGATGSGTSAGGSKTAVDVCAAVPVSRVASITGRSGYLDSNGGPTTQSGANASVCTYFDHDDATIQYSLTIVVFRGGDPSTIFADRSRLFPGLHSISGIGDRAQGDSADLEVAYGSDVITVTDALHPDNSDLTIGQLSQLVEAAHAVL